MSNNLWKGAEGAYKIFGCKDGFCLSETKVKPLFEGFTDFLGVTCQLCIYSPAGK